MATLILPQVYTPVRSLPPMRLAEFRLALDSGKFRKALGFFPPENRAAAAVELWDTVPRSARPLLIADLLSGAANLATEPCLLTGFLAQALRSLSEVGQPVCDCATSLRALRALPGIVIAWRADDSGCLPGAGLIWNLQRSSAVMDCQNLRSDGMDACVFVVRVSRAAVAGYLRGMRVVIEPRYTMQAEVIEGVQS